nr:MAG TPA: hypothetical protein [Caudoviricetes sp.]
MFKTLNLCENGSVGAYLCTPTPFPLCPEVYLRLRAFQQALSR